MSFFGTKKAPLGSTPVVQPNINVARPQSGVTSGYAIPDNPEVSLALQAAAARQIGTADYDPVELQKQLESSSPAAKIVQGDFVPSGPNAPLLPRAGDYSVVERTPPPIRSNVDQVSTGMVAVPALPPTENANTRLLVPTKLPDFLNPDGDVVRKQLIDAERQVAPAYSPDGIDYDKFFEANPNKRGASNPYINLSVSQQATEALKTKAHAEAIGSFFTESTGIMHEPAVQKQVEEDFGLTEENAEEVGPQIKAASLLALSRLSDDIYMRRYEKQIEKPEDDVYQGDPDDTRAKREWAKQQANAKNRTPEDRANAWSDMVGNITHEPVIQGVIQGISTSLGRLTADKSAPSAMYAPKQFSQLTASALLFSFYEAGYIDIGKDKYGRVYPFLTQAGMDFRNDTHRITTLYDPELRHLNVNSPIVRSVSNPTRNLGYANLQHLYTKDSRVKDGNYTLQEAASLYTSNVGVTVHTVTYSLLEQQRKDIDTKMVWSMLDGTAVPPNTRDAIPNAYSTSEYSTTQSDLSKEKFIEKVAELQAAGLDFKAISEEITAINKAKGDQDRKDIFEYMKGNIGKGARFDVIHLSPATKRMFGTASDINLINKSGTIRPGTKFANITRFVPKHGDTPLLQSNRVKALARNLYNTAGSEGMGIGSTIHKKLMSADKADRSLLGAYFMIAKAAETLGYIKIPVNRAAPDIYINAITPRILEDMALFGKQVLDWSNGRLPTDSTRVNLPPAFDGKGGLGALFQKKEWSPAITNAVMAFNLLNSLKTGVAVDLDGTIEMDATQSNAFIISTIIGDTETAGLLGADVSEGAFNEFKATFKDLRAKAASTIDDDIVETFIGKDDAGIVTGLSKLFKVARDRLGSSFDKVYARGLVVAGLYGKSPLFMFTECEEMLTHLHGVASAELDDLIRTQYNGDRNELIQDICSLYSTSMRKHMFQLQGYQRLLSVFGAVKAAFNGSSQIKSFGKTTIDIGIRHAVPYDDETNEIKNILHIDQAPLMGKTGSVLTAPGDYGRGISDIYDMMQRMVDTNANMSDIQKALKETLIEYTSYGDKAKKALPVDLIQSGDAYMMAVAITFANKDFNEDIPLNIKSVHDAIIADPASVLLAYNAYNNISPFIVVENSIGILTAINESMEEDQARAQDAVKAAGVANIGMKGTYKAMSGYFDRLYFSSTWVDRDIKRGRIKENDSGYDWKAELKRRAEEILNYVQGLETADGKGWFPPIERYRDKRDNMYITPSQFNKMSNAILEHSGLLSGPYEKPNILTSPKDKSHVWKQTRALKKFIDSNRAFKAKLAKTKAPLNNMR